MFNSEIERKIIDFVKKNAVGVSSGDIAKYLGLNRMTITKYLAIIKEKALIDFKRFGMAKIWYIPVKIDKNHFLEKIVSILGQNFENEAYSELLQQAGEVLGEEINDMYLKFYKVQRLGYGQVADAFADIGIKLGGNFKVQTKHIDRILVIIERSPFENQKNMLKVLAAVFGSIASKNLGNVQLKFYTGNEKEKPKFEIILSGK